MENNQDRNIPDQKHPQQLTTAQTTQEYYHDQQPQNNLNYLNTPSLIQAQPVLNYHDNKNPNQNTQQFLNHPDSQITLQYNYHDVDKNLQQQKSILEDKNQLVMQNASMQQTSPTHQTQNQQLQYTSQQQQYQNSQTNQQFPQAPLHYGHPVYNPSPYYRPPSPQQISPTSNANVQFQQQPPLPYQLQQNMNAGVAYGMPSVYQNTNMVQDDQQQPLLVIDHSSVPLQYNPQPQIVIQPVNSSRIRRRRRIVSLLVLVFVIFWIIWFTTIY
eukprot:403357840